MCMGIMFDIQCSASDVCVTVLFRIVSHFALDLFVLFSNLRGSSLGVYSLMGRLMAMNRHMPIEFKCKCKHSGYSIHGRHLIV